MNRLKRVGVLSVGLVAGVVYGAFGLLVGGIIALISVVGGGLAATDGSALGGMMGGVAAVVVVPLAYGILGALGAMIGALLYNLAARFTGGIEIEIG